MQKSMSRTWKWRCSIEWSAWKTHLIILWFSIEWHELQHYVPTTSFNPVLWVSTSTYAINHIIARPIKLSKSSSLRIKWRVTLGISTKDSNTRPPQTRNHRHASLSSFAEPHTKDLLGVLKASTCVSSVFFFFEYSRWWSVFSKMNYIQVRHSSIESELDMRVQYREVHPQNQTANYVYEISTYSHIPYFCSSRSSEMLDSVRTWVCCWVSERAMFLQKKHILSNTYVLPWYLNGSLPSLAQWVGCKNAPPPPDTINVGPPPLLLVCLM